MNNNQDNKNLLIIILLFMVVMFAFNFFSSRNTINTEQIESLQERQQELIEKPAQEKVELESELNSPDRIFLQNANINASINLQGGIIDSLTLKHFKDSSKQNNEIRLFAPKGTDEEYYYTIEYKEFVDTSTKWVLQSQQENSRVVILQTIQNNLEIERIITIDDEYIINIKDKIKNSSSIPIKLCTICQLLRNNPQSKNYAVAHEGLIGNFDSKVQEIKYAKIKASTKISQCSWIGYTDIYWLCAIINNKNKGTAIYSKSNETLHKCSINSSEITIAPEATIDLDYCIYTGPKDLKILKKYQQSLNIDKFEMAIDFGWFFMLTKPMLHLLNLLANFFNNMGLVILFLTLFFKLLTYPLMKKSLKSAAKMREIQPKITQLQKLYSADKMRMNQELAALYKKKNITPLAGCLPMLLQMPIFFCLYKVFFISLKMRYAPLFGWISDLSAPDSCYIANLFGAIDWTPPGIFCIGVWPLIMGLTMFLQQKLASPKNNTQLTPEAKIQQNMMLVMPVIFTYICSSFPVSVVIYWTISNIFSIVQQYFVNKNITQQKIKIR